MSVLPIAAALFRVLGFILLVVWFASFASDAGPSWVSTASWIVCFATAALHDLLYEVRLLRNPPPAPHIPTFKQLSP